MTFDLRMLEALQNARTPLLTNFFKYFTYFGSELLFIILFCYIFWCVNKKDALKIGFAFFLATFATQMMKIAFSIDRPWIRSSVLEPVDGAVSGAGGYSFPSGHSSGAASFYGALATVYKSKAFRIAIIVIIALVAFSRLYLGVHTVQDVAAGLLLGALCVFIADMFWTDAKENVTTVCVTGMVLSILGLAYAMFKPYRSVDDELIAESFKTVGATLGYFISWLIEEHKINFVPIKDKLLGWSSFAVGFAGVALIHIGSKKMLNAALGLAFGGLVRYFLLPVFIMLIMPLCINLVRKKTGRA